MKKLLTIIFLSLFLNSTSIAEKYECAYIFDDKAKPASFERSGNFFIIGNNVSQDKILFENEIAIFLTQVYINDNVPMGYMTVIDKVKLNFVMAGLRFENSTAIIEGSCDLVK
jgi:hypothetical protein